MIRGRLDRLPTLIHGTSSTLSSPYFPPSLSFADNCTKVHDFLSFPPLPHEQIVHLFELTTSAPFEEGALAFARLAPKYAREAIAIVDVAPREKRTALVALHASSWSRALVR